MFRHKTKIIVLGSVMLLVAFLGVFILYRNNQNDQLPKTDNYFWDKYGNDNKNHDACVAEFNERGQTEGRLIGVPCPGEPQ